MPSALVRARRARLRFVLFLAWKRRCAVLPPVLPPPRPFPLAHAPRRRAMTCGAPCRLARRVVQRGFIQPPQRRRAAAPSSRPAQSPSRARCGCAEGLPPRRKRDLARRGDGGGASLACLRRTPDPFAQLPQSLPRCALCRRYRLELAPAPRAADGNCDGREPAAVFRTEGESAARPERSCGVHRRPLALRDVWGQLLPHVLAARLPRPR